MPTPHDSKESAEVIKWKIKSRDKELIISNCISSWTDICGFGSLLEKVNWDLNNLQNLGITQFLNEFHFLAGQPLLIDIDPLPNDKVIVLNDGIARTIDLLYIDKLSSFSFLVYFRELLFTHYRLLRFTRFYNVGVRTILAGGQRVQYSPSSTTGHSVLYYDEKRISNYGKKILNTTYVYNPAEFQMNTAFAKAFTIDSIGTKGNILINGLFIESDYFTKIEKIIGLRIEFLDNYITFFLDNIKMFNLSINNTAQINIKGLETIVYHIDKFYIYKEFDGDDLVFDLYKQED